MEHSKLTWEDLIKFEEVAGYGQHIWKHGEQYYLVEEEGGIAVQRVVYELPTELFKLLESGEKTMVDIHYKLQNDVWPSNVSQEEADRIFLRANSELLKNDVGNQALFTRQELEELLPEGSEILSSSDD